MSVAAFKLQPQSWVLLTDCLAQKSSNIYLLGLDRSFVVVRLPSLVWLTLLTHGLWQARLPCPLLSPRVCSNSCPLSRWCHPTISSSCHPLLLPSGSFPMSWLFTSDGQSIGASASVLPVSIQGSFPLGLTGLQYLHGGSIHFCTTSGVWWMFNSCCFGRSREACVSVYNYTCACVYIVSCKFYHFPILKFRRQ